VAPDETVDVQRTGSGRLELRVAGRLVASARLQSGGA
jgi:hypothetical protein